MLKFIYVLCVITLGLGAAQIMWMYKDVPFSFDHLFNDPAMMVWVCLVSSIPLLFIGYGLLRWAMNRREQHRSRLGHQMSYLRRKVRNAANGETHASA